MGLLNAGRDKGRGQTGWLLVALAVVVIAIWMLSRAQ
jgi:hypothetical protein